MVQRQQYTTRDPSAARHDRLPGVSAPVRRRHSPRQTLAASRGALLLTLSVLLAVGGVLFLITDSIVGLLAALAVHAIVTVAVAFGIVAMLSGDSGAITDSPRSREVGT